MSFASIVAIKRCSLMDFGSSTEQLAAERPELVDFMRRLAVLDFTCFSLLQR